MIEDVPALVMEYAENGSLIDFLANQTEPMNESLRMKIAMEIAEGISYLHCKGIVHSMSLSADVH